jgi:hypothetical protein
MHQMMGTTDRRRSLRLQRRGCPFVTDQARARRTRGVDRLANQRMAKAKTTRHVAGSQQLARDQIVKRRQRVCASHHRCRDREIELERISDHGRGLCKLTNASTQPIKLGSDRRPHCTRNLSLTRPLCSRGPRHQARGGARELQQIERVTAALPIKPLQVARCDLPDQHPRLITIQRPELKLVDHPPSRRLGDRRREHPRCLPAANRRGEHHRRLWRAPEQVADELHRRIVAPLQIIEREQQRPRARQPLKQLSRRKMSAEALRRRAQRGTSHTQRTQRRKNASQLAQLLRSQAVKRACIKRPQVSVKRVHQQPKRKVPLQLRRPPPQHQAPSRSAAARQLAKQGTLADARLAGHDHKPRRPRTRVRQQPRQPV